MSRKTNYRRLSPWQWLLMLPWATLQALLGWAVVVGSVAGGVWVWQWLHTPNLLPPLQVVIQTQLHHQPRAELEQNLRAWVASTHFITLDVYALRAQLEHLPWIARATVRKRWPNQVEVQVQEHVPYARWGERELVTVAGLRFAPPPAQIPAQLPQLTGPDGYEQRLIRQYQVLTQRFQGVALQLASIHLDQRLAWRLTLDTGTEIWLGTHHVGPRLQRFLGYYAQPRFLGQVAQMARVDLRYPNGFAIAWRDPKVEEAAHG